MDRLASWYAESFALAVDRAGVSSSGVPFAILSRHGALIDIPAARRR